VESEGQTLGVCFPGVAAETVSHEATAPSRRREQRAERSPSVQSTSAYAQVPDRGTSFLLTQENISSTDSRPKAANIQLVALRVSRLSDVTLCILVRRYQCFEGIFYIHHQRRRI
jgi:hypothetical protein